MEISKDPQVIKLNRTIQEFDALGCWVLADFFRKQLTEYIKMKEAIL